MQFILIIAGIILIFSTQTIVVIYALPAIAIAYFYILVVVKMFDLKSGSVGMIVNTLIAFLLAIGLFVYILVGSPAWNKWVAVGEMVVCNA